MDIKTNILKRIRSKRITKEQKGTGVKNEEVCDESSFG